LVLALRLLVLLPTVPTTAELSTSETPLAGGEVKVFEGGGEVLKILESEEIVVVEIVVVLKILEPEGMLASVEGVLATVEGALAAVEGIRAAVEGSALMEGAHAVVEVSVDGGVDGCLKVVFAEDDE
jgi:hypothetical protein